ncbi:E3 ubiquitin-protein ligase MIB2-like isoform X14 [Octopus vulgaris]|uniref:E3 ubiquitin-protein ligase MIB2-like isoform X14 n=1 Tax=Octopus vulgaris TaxID=6645 RepID=A0AA36C1Z4_OCTVU|nr:E3 ubiquitin-protein ligase MIB2-like isoform X14 [Octopus vulgaris]
MSANILPIVMARVICTDCSTTNTSKIMIATVHRIFRPRETVNNRNSNGVTVLMAACERGNKELITLLTESGADLNIGDKDKKWTALHYAVVNHKTDVVAFLVSSGANVNKQDSGGDTPLHLAVWNKYEDVVKVLLNSKENNNLQDSVKLDIANNDKRTPLLEAVYAAHIGIVHKLITCGANMNAIDKHGNNCLHIAAEKEEFCSEKEHITILDECCAKLGLPTEKRLSGVGVAGYLAHQGANLYRKNNENVAPLDLIGDADLKEKFKELFPPQKCMLCEVNEASMELQPCAHTVLCEDCSKINLKDAPSVKHV